MNVQATETSAKRITKILAVHSYSSDFPWTSIILQNYKDRLKNKKLNFEIKNLYYDIKKSPKPLNKEHPLSSQIEFQIKKWKPDIMFLTDDYSLHQNSIIALSTKTPIIFAGINGEIPGNLIKADHKIYSGVYERYYAIDTLRLLQRLQKKKTLSVLVLLEDSETARFVKKTLLNQVKLEKFIKLEIFESNSFIDWKNKILKSNNQFDAFFPIQPFGLHDRDLKYITPQEVISWISQNSLKPTLYTSAWQIKCGGTFAITHRPSSQGILAADLTLKVLDGIFPDPITPTNGDIEINYEVTEKLKIKIPFDLLTSANITKKITNPCAPQ